MNKVLLIGRPTKDPEVRYTTDNKAIARLTLAVDRKYKTDGGQTADFISCTSFGKTAEFIEKYVTKGTRYAVVGRIQTGSYTNREGNKVFATDVVIEDIEFCESKNRDTSETRNSVDTDGFMAIPDNVDDDGLPFN